MSFFGDVVKVAKKGIKKIKSGARKVIKAVKPLTPAVALVPGIGPALAPAVATGVQAAEAIVGPEERKRRKRGVPRRGISLARSLGPGLARITGQAIRTAAGGRRVVTPALPAARPTPASIRTVPARAMDARFGRPVTGATAMPMQPVSGGLQPAGFQFQVPRPLREPIQTLRESLPFRFGSEPTTRALVPLTESVDKIGRPLIVQAQAEQRVRCPPGYLAVTMPDGSRACVLAGVAIAAGLAKRRKKPLISVRETNALRVADRARGKVKRVAMKSGFQVRERRSTTRRKS